MGTKTFLLLSTTLVLLFTLRALAGEVSGKTADGCTYKVINGQYLTSCPSRARSEGPTHSAQAAAAPATRDQVRARSAAPVTDYGAVPVRQNQGMSAPSIPPQQPNQSAPVSSIQRESSVQDLDELDGAKRERQKAKIIDKTYVGLQIGASNMKESNAGSSTGFGLDIGTNIDDIFGVEIGYSYAKQDLNLGLASRGSSVDPTQQQQQNGGFSSGVRPSTDSSLSSNLFTGEVQAHLTDPVKRLRPYVGAGLGWRSATLSENPDPNGSGLAGGSLHQNALGGLASAGTKLRLTKTLNLGFCFRYFFPIVRQDSRVEQPVATAANQSAGTSKLSSGDDPLTGSSQYQVLGGVQYSF